MASPLIFTKQALPLLQSAVAADHRQLAKLSRSHRGAANSLTPVTETLMANNRKLVEIGRHSAETLEQAVSIMMRNAEFSKEISKIMDNVTSVATAVEEMAATATEISRTAQQAAKRAEESSAKAATGNENISSLMGDMDLLENAIKSMADGMNQFVGFSREINKLTAIVRDIAHQTNLLALNAAIEAARAGEAGRGFAVVADEVKKLADKTAQATTEIESVTNTMNSLSEDVGESVTTSLDRLKKSVDTLESVATVLAEGNNVVNDVSDRVHQIAVAAEEQSAVSAEMAANLSTITSALNDESREVATISQHARALTQTATHQSELLAQWGHDALVLHAAKSDHLLWKSRLADALHTKHSVTEADLKDHHPCRLDGWCKTNHARFGDVAAFRAVTEQHAKLHALGQEVIELSARGQIDGANAKLEQIDHVSQELCAHLDRLAQDVTAA